MAKLVEVKIVGARAGQNVTLCGVEFVAGKAQVGSNNDDLLILLGSYHNAHVVGSEECAAAQRQWDEAHPKAEPTKAPAEPTKAPAAPVKK